MMVPKYSYSGVDLYHGDVLEILKALPDNSADAVISDPPYCSGGRQQAGARNTISKTTLEDDEWFLGDNMGGDSYIWWMREIARECLRIATPGSMAFIFTDWRQWTTVTTAWETMRWTLRSAFVWDKDRGGAMGSYWRSNHEMAAIFTKGRPRPLAHRSAFNTWRGSKPQDGNHQTEKPIDLMKYIVSTVTPADARILDMFMGSGTTGVAAADLGYRFIGIEVEEAHVNTAVDRLRALQAQEKLF